MQAVAMVTIMMLEPAFFTSQFTMGSNRPISPIMEKYTMEKMNSTAVDQVLETPAFTKSKIWTGVNPQISAAITGTMTNRGTGLDFPRIRAATMMITIKKPTVPKNIMQFPPSEKMPSGGLAGKRDKSSVKL